MKNKKPLLCRLGLHKWRELGWLDLMLTGIAYECLRCHRREARHWYGTIYEDAPADGWRDDKLERAK